MKKLLLGIGLVSLAACGGVPDKIDDDQVYFAFDSAEISRASERDLQSQAAYMKKNQDINVVLGGHCDERGSVEYNLALGALRAGNAAHVIQKEGIEPTRIKTISYGKENPQYLGTGEKVWAKNRNVTTKVNTPATTK